MATIKDIAKKSGYSPSTVSYALRDNPKISEEVRKHIKGVARELGYHPDARLGELMAHLKSGKLSKGVCPITWINSSSHPQHWKKTPWAIEFYESAEKRAKELGFALDQIWVHDPNITPSRLNSILQTRGCRGLILSTPLQDQDWVHWVDWNSYATVVLDDPAELPQFDHVYALYCSNMRIALEQIFLRGYKRPKLWLSSHDDYWTARGYTHTCLREAHMHPELGDIITEACDELSEEALGQWMEKHSPDVVIAPTPTVGMRLQKMGYSIPGDVGYVAMYVLNEDSEWSGISQLHQQQACIAIERMANLVHMNSMGPRAYPLHIQIKGEWHEGTTLDEVQYGPVDESR